MSSSATRAKLFTHGGSQTVRLPSGFRLPGNEAAISRTAEGGILLEPLNADFEKRRRKFCSLAGSCPDLPDVAEHTVADMPRDK